MQRRDYSSGRSHRATVSRLPVILERELLMAQVAFAAGAIKDLVELVLGETHMFTALQMARR
jgi:hypothetical protein